MPLSQFPQKELIIAVVDNGNAILMRKKPAGSEPYLETWYLFGCEVNPDQDVVTTIQNYLKEEIGINVEADKLSVSYAQETKKDHDGTTKLFIYTNLVCRYINGTPKLPKGAEKIEWLLKEKLSEYDLVPPSVSLLKSLKIMQ